MHLGYGCSGYRGRIEGRKKRVQPTSEFALDQGLRFATREGWQSILQTCQIDGELFAEQVGPGRQQLTELDKARPQFLERSREALAWARPKHTPAARQNMAEPDEPSGGRNRPQRRQRIVSRQDQTDTDQADKIAEAAQKPEAGSGQVKGARLSGAQRRPPSNYGI
jgi:hypothetical protein